MNQELKNKGKLYLFVACSAILFYFILLRFEEVGKFIDDLQQLLFPFIVGFVIAFLLNKPMLWIDGILIKNKMKPKAARAISAVLALILGIICVCAVVGIMIPQLWQSTMSLIKSAPGLIENFIYMTQQYIVDHNIDVSMFRDMFGTINVQTIINSVMDIFTTSIPQIFALGTHTVNILFDILIGLIAGLYLMLDKESFILAIKSMVYAFLKKEKADYIVRFTKITARVFNDFIIGKAIDSLIIGIITFAAMSLLKMPYALLLSAIVGITNMIPVFGPFIGAVPGIFILTIINPITGIYFSLLILAIQQLDGNVIGPIILGDKLGVPSFAILFSVCIFGGFMGVVGMIIGVPIFAVLFIAIREMVEERLKEKEITFEELSKESVFEK